MYHYYTVILYAYIQNKYFLDAIKNVSMCYTIILYYYFTTIHCHHTKSTHGMRFIHASSAIVPIMCEKSKIKKK